MGETHGRVKDDQATLKILITNTKSSTLSGLLFLLNFFSTGFTGGYSDFIPLGYFIDFSEWVHIFEIRIQSLFFHPINQLIPVSN
jgi:hypothetical protein